MAHVDYDHTIISQVPGKEASLGAPGEHEPEMPIIGHAAAFPSRIRRFAHRERALLARASKFLVVGGTGVLVNNLALLLLFQWAHLPLVVASALSVELGIVNNFYWNDRWTFRRTGLSVTRFAQFNLVSLGGLVITTGTLWILASHLGLYYLAANLLGIALATAWNFVVNSLWTWRGAL